MAYRDGQRTILPVYAFGPTAPARARTFAPEKLAPRFFTAHDAKRLLFQWPWPSLGLQERQHHRELMVLLAEELHRRDHGGPPASEADLVGTYLESLPDDGTAELDLGPIPVVEDAPKPPNHPSDR